MKSKTFIEYKKAIATSVLPGAIVRLVRRQFYVNGEIIYTVAAGNCIWANATTFAEMEAYFNQVTK